jgi:hypothetical protein
LVDLLEIFILAVDTFVREMLTLVQRIFHQFVYGMQACRVYVTSLVLTRRDFACSLLQRVLTPTLEDFLSLVLQHLVGACGEEDGM